MAYDQKCYDLAEAFLEDWPKLNKPAVADRLAQVIQDAIEAEIADIPHLISTGVISIDDPTKHAKS